MDRCFLISCAVVAAALSTSGEVVAGSSKRPGKAFAADDETSPALNRVTEPGSFGGHEKGANLQTGDGGQPSRLTGEPPVQACQFSTSPEKLQVELNPYSLEAKFDCGLSIGTNTVEPDCKTAATNNCCDKAGEHCDTSISTAVGVKGSAVMDTNTKLVSVKLEDTPENPEGQLHFKCTKASNTCIVTVNMPAPLKGNQCNFDKTVKLPPIASPEGEAKFECRGPVKIKPTGATVLTGDECTGTASSLNELVPGAQLTETEDGAYTLKVAALPPQTQKLCFQCVYPGPRKSKRTQESTAPCNVTVTVKGRGSDPSKTTTASTTASSVEGVAVTWLAVLASAVASTASM